MSQTGQKGRNIFTEALEAATGIFSQTGQMPDLSDVASAINAPEETISTLFSTKHALMEAMAENALMLLYDQCVRTVVKADGQDPVAQFHALSDAYIEWAYNHPREFRIIGSMPAEDFQKNERLMRYEQSIHELMLRLLTRAQSLGQLSESDDLPIIIAVAHTFAYGVVSKMLLGDLSRWAGGMNELEAARAAMRIFTSKVLGHNPA